MTETAKPLVALAVIGSFFVLAGVVVYAYTKSQGMVVPSDVFLYTMILILVVSYGIKALLSN